MKGNNYWVIVWSILVALVIVMIPTAIRQAPELVGKTYVDSEEFQTEINAFYARVGPVVLNPIDFDEAKEKLVVTSEEIHEHRMRYGTLTEQITNIKDQYVEEIEEAKQDGNQALQSRLMEEREAKLIDIEKNFESDEYIEKKILAEKIGELKRYLNNMEEIDVSSFPIEYELTDIDTGEVFTKGNLTNEAAYIKTFDGNVDYLEATSSEGPLDVYGNEHYWTVAVESGEITGLSNRDLAEIQNPVKRFEGTVLVSKKSLESSFLKENVQGFNHMKSANYSLWQMGLLSLVLLFTVLKFRKEWVTKNKLVPYYDALKIDVKVILLFLTVFITIEILFSRVESIFYYQHWYRGVWADLVYWLGALAVGVWAIAFQLVNAVERWKKDDVLTRDIKESYAISFLQAFWDMFLNRSLGIQMFILLIGFFLAGIGFMVVLIQPVAIIVYIPLVLFFGLPALYLFVRRAAYLSRIFVATEAMAEGKLNKEINVEGKSPLAKHAVNLNNLRAGVQLSMTEQAKSERLKTELITNVSHDLRTPLTSIITYTDLLKSAELSVEDRLKYVDVLDKKSQRLKTLIEDLFEVSKMASGNLELNKQRLDLTQLLQQALAEHAEEISTSQLDFRVKLPEDGITAYVDGQRWWRVLDNLIVNAIKYALPGTRVYITLQQIDHRAQFVVKNVSAYELNEEAEALFERFKRADASRHTEGSGLGLAISQSIVEMHAGVMKIDIDGDLFKVTVEIPTI